MRNHPSIKQKRALVPAIAVATATIGALVAGLAPASAAPFGKPAAYDVPDFPITVIGPAHDDAKPDIVVIDAGGTITSTAEDRISYQHYAASIPGGVQQILEDMYPELAPVANLSVAKSAGSLGTSSRVTYKTLYDISRTVDAILANPDIDGIVVTAGTNVLEEDAYFLDLTVRSPKPVVVTGAMHQYGTFTYDGYTNLFSSIRLAASGKTTCFGTVVLLNDQFFTARDATKTDGYRTDTFGVNAHGLLGVVNENIIRTMSAPPRITRCGTRDWAPPFDLTQITPDQIEKVDIVSGYIEASAATISGVVAGGAKGIVTAGHGPGGLDQNQAPAQQDAIDKGVVFVSATRTGGEGTYESGRPGIIGAGDLLPQKARLLLALGLTFSDDAETVRGWFDTVGNPAFDLSDMIGRGQADSNANANGRGTR